MSKVPLSLNHLPHAIIDDENRASLVVIFLHNEFVKQKNVALCIAPAAGGSAIWQQSLRAEGVVT